jgi:hypothetical protein
MTLRLPKQLHDDLKKAAGDRSVSEELRQRLQASFGEAAAPADEKTNSLLAQLAKAAARVTKQFGPWHETRRAYAIFSRAVAIGLRDYAPDDNTELSDSEKDIEVPAIMVAVDAGFQNVW